MSELLGLGPTLDTQALLTLGARLGINLVFATIVIHVVYYRLYRNLEYVFTYYSFNVITFCLSLLLTKVPMELGFALGLFAVFGILRYRTEAVRIRDQTYLFIVIGIGIINAVANNPIGLVELVAVNSVIVGMTAILELCPKGSKEKSTLISYDNLELLKPGCETELFCDLIMRTGLRVTRVNVRHVDMLRDAAEIEVRYTEEGDLQ